VGRLKLLTSDWRLFSVSEQSMSDITSYPPPGFS
jgi:hypothetical protein